MLRARQLRVSSLGGDPTAAVHQRAAIKAIDLRCLCESSGNFGAILIAGASSGSNAVCGVAGPRTALCLNRSLLCLGDVDTLRDRKLRRNQPGADICSSSDKRLFPVDRGR